MVYKADKLRLRKLLMDAISLLCKNGLPVQSAFRIEATIGITLSEDEVVLVSFREVVQPDGVAAPQDEDEASDEEASSALSRVEDLDGDEDTKKDDEASPNRPSQRENENENETWSEVGDFAFAGNSNVVGNNPGVIGNSDMQGNSNLKKRTSINNYSQRDNAFPYDETSRVRPDRRSRPSVPVKNEVVEDDDCTFVKIEDGCGEAAFDPLVPDDGWMYQVYNESNLYNNSMGSDLLAQGQDCEDMASETLVPASNQSWYASPRDINARSNQPHRGGSGTHRGGGVARSGARHSLPASSRSQAMVNGLCQRIISSSTAESSGGFLCHICQARLGNIQTLRNHIKKTHLALKIERCRACGAAFRWASQLARHKKREHPVGGVGGGVGGAPPLREGLSESRVAEVMGYEGQGYESRSDS